MSILIKDPQTDELVRKLAETRNISLTEAVFAACHEALENDMKNRSARAKARASLAALDALPDIGALPDKAFYDREWS